jgi:hypothetical protein
MKTTIRFEKPDISRRIAHIITLRCGALAMLCIILLHSSVNLRAQSYSIDRFKIAGGGGVSTGGVYSVSGTIGQPDATPQPMTGGDYSLAGGFWPLFALQTPGAPLLNITLTATNTAVVSWLSSSIGFTLQQNSDLGATIWVAAPQTVNDNGTNKFVIVNPPIGNRFYRLRWP